MGVGKVDCGIDWRIIDLRKVQWLRVSAWSSGVQGCPSGPTSRRPIVAFLTSIPDLNQHKFVTPAYLGGRMRGWGMWKEGDSKRTLLATGMGSGGAVAGARSWVIGLFGVGPQSRTKSGTRGYVVSLKARRQGRGPEQLTRGRSCGKKRKSGSLQLK